MKKCDICNEVTNILEPILASFQTEDIKEVCPGCLKILNEQFHKLNETLSVVRKSWFKRFIFNMRRRLE